MDDSDDFKTLELDKICRCCLTVKKEMRPLFGQLISKMITECVAIKVDKIDGWPDKICLQCVQQVSRFHSFKRRLEVLDQKLREYIQGLTVVKEVEKEVAQETPISQIGGGQQVLARAPSGPQVLSQTRLLPGSGPFAQATTIQMPPNTHIVQHGGQLIPVQVLPTNTAQMVQIKQNGQKACEIILSPQHLRDFPGSNQLTTQSIIHRAATATQEEDPVAYYEMNIQDSSKQMDEMLDVGGGLPDNDNEFEEEVEDYEEEELEEGDGEGREFYIVEEISDTDYELVNADLGTHQLEGAEAVQNQHQEEVPVVFSKDNTGDDFDELINSSTLTETTTQMSNSTETPNIELGAVENYNQVSIAISDSEEDPEEMGTMAEFISLQTSCPAPGRHICNLCHKEFKYSKWLHSHMKLHSNWFKANCKKQPECHICHKKFKGPGMLRMHMKTHEERCFKCELCLKMFQNQYHLSIHLAKHKRMEGKAFPCDRCGVTFVSNNDLRTHKRTHTHRISQTKKSANEEDHTRAAGKSSESSSSSSCRIKRTR